MTTTRAAAGERKPRAGAAGTGDAAATAAGARTAILRTNSPAQTTLYGIPNCDQVKKARAWLDVHQITYAFHDFKKKGLSAALARAWLDEAGPERIINRKGTTWRALDDGRKALVDKASGAVTLLCEAPSLVKRPVLAHGSSLTIGFDATDYQRLFP